MNLYLRKYKEGECKEVRNRLQKLEGRIREEPYYSYAKEVMKEVMEKVKNNIEHLYDELKKINFRFGYSDDGSVNQWFRGVIIPPSADVEEKINRVESIVGFLPLSIKYFWQIVGGVNFMGYHPDWPTIYYDSLFVYPVEIILEELEERTKVNETPKSILISPDYYHKACTSGGSPYEILIPNKDFDAILENEEHSLYFVDYLQFTFMWAGYPGYENNKIDFPLELIDISYTMLSI